VPIGVRLAEHYLRHDPPTDKELTAMDRAEAKLPAYDA
jgi:hypothetical protein